MNNDLAHTQIATTTYKQKMHVLPNDLIGKRLLERNMYDPSGVAFVAFALSKLDEPIALDIGANIGVYTLVMSTLAKHVFAFEPQENIFTILSENLKLNGIENVTAEPYGLSRENATLPFFVNMAGNAGASGFTPECRFSEHRETKVEVREGTQALRDLNCDSVDLIKIDVEGHEAEVVEGLKPLLSSNRPIVMLEWNSDSIRNAFATMNLFDTVFKDYEVHAIVSSYRRSAWAHKSLGNLRLKLHRLLSAETWKFVPFTRSEDFGNIALIPNEKRALFSV